MSLRNPGRRMTDARNVGRPQVASARGLLVVVGASVALIAAPVAATVPFGDSGGAVITVKVGGDRLSGAITDTGPVGAAVTGVGGARLGLFATAADADPVNATWAVCTSDGDGDCSFLVPDTEVGGVNRDARFVVKQLSAPTGWSANTSLRTYSSPSGSGVRPYRFQTGPELRAGVTYTSSDDFMYTSADAASFDDVNASSGVWQQSRTNPAVARHCGLDVALVIDTSSSVGSDMPNLVAAADALVDSLAGTPSRIATFSFAATSPGAAAGPNHPDLTSVSTQDGADAVKAQYASWSPSGGTNWDSGLFKPAEAAAHYDIAVVITDGNPTYYGAPLPAVRSVHATRFKELEYGIFAANALKAEGTRVIVLGVGTGLNLPAISGPIAYDGTNPAEADHYDLADYAGAGQALRALSTRLCAGSVSVVTQIVPPGNVDGDFSGSAPAGAGWEVAGSTSTPGVGGLPATAVTTDDGTGAVNLPLTFEVGVSSAAVTITPTSRAAHRLVDQAGRHASCTDLASGAVIPVTDDDSDPGRPGFLVDAAAETGVTCTVYSTEDRSGAGSTQTTVAPGSAPNATPALVMDARIGDIRDTDADGFTDVGDTISYEFGVTNDGSATLRDVAITSPLIGAVVCPSVTLSPGSSMTCSSHAPYVITAVAATRGLVESRAVARGVTLGGQLVGSKDAVTVTTIDDSGDGAGGSRPVGIDLAAGPGDLDGQAVTAAHGESSGSLPDAGGPQVAFGVMGLLLILGGASVLLRATRWAAVDEPSP